MVHLTETKHCRSICQALFALCLFALLCFFSGFSQASPRGISAVGAGASRPGSKVALVIGNADYAKGRLRNSVNDARAMAQTLARLGFQAHFGENLDYQSMRRKIIEFGRALDHAEVGLFYFAGHGVQVDGHNYLIPIGARIRHAEEVPVEAVGLDVVLTRMAGARNGLNIVILDACRDNPYEREFRSGGQKGLAQMAAPKGTFVAYATSPGSVAADGSGRHGVYTESLIRHIAEPGVPIEKVFKQVRMEVAAKTRNQQVPWDESSLMGEFFFVPDGEKPLAQPQEVELAPQLEQAPQTSPDKTRIDELLDTARADLEARRLTTPEGNNALANYQRVLRLDPTNKAANQGLQRIVGVYVDMAKRSMELKAWNQAAKYLDRADMVREGDERVLTARADMSRLRAEAKAHAEAQKRKVEAERQRREEEQRRVEAEKQKKILLEIKQCKRRDPNNRFCKDDEDIITDWKTGLQWYVGPDKPTSLSDARDWVESLTIDGGGWRMPTRDDLAEISQKVRGLNPKYLPWVFGHSAYDVYTEERCKDGKYVFSFCHGEARCDTSLGRGGNDRGFAVRARK